MSEAEEWMTVTEAAKYLKLTRRTLYRYMDSGDLPYYQLGEKGPRRVKRADVEALLREGKEVAA